MSGKIVKKYKFYGVGDLCYILYINMLEKRIIIEFLRKKSDRLVFFNERNLEK